MKQSWHVPSLHKSIDAPQDDEILMCFVSLPKIYNTHLTETDPFRNKASAKSLFFKLI